MSDQLPYLPDIIEATTSRISTITQAFPVGPFSVRFESGIYSQVGKSVYKTKLTDEVLIWLVMNFEEDRGKDYSNYAETNLSIIIATKTDAKYTQKERDTISFKPKLIPVYSELLHQIHLDKNLFTESVNKIRHKRVLRPYWGGGDVSGTDTQNLFKEFIDAIEIKNLNIKIKHFQKDCP